MRLLTKLVLIAVLVSSCVSTKLPSNTSDYAKTSAMITLDNKRTGGSGVIIKSTPNSSLILTNKHVCMLVQVGGVVTTDQGSYPIHSFRVYKRHDLCLIEVLTNLHENNRLADHPPKSYEEVIVAGHPALLPTMVTRGHFGNHMPLQLIIGKQECNGDEEDRDAFFCKMTGYKPLTINFETQPITATIMAGSSGSGVFNDKGEISGLVFAGDEGLSYGFIVPYEYVKDFLDHATQYVKQIPNANSKQDFFAILFKMQKACKSNPQNCKGLAFQSIQHD